MSETFEPRNEPKGFTEKAANDTQYEQSTTEDAFEVPNYIAPREAANDREFSQVEAQHRDAEVREQSTESEPEPTPAELRAQIEEINTLVQNSQLDSSSAEQRVADLEQQIYEAEAQEHQRETESKLNDLKAKIEAVNTQVQTSQLDSEAAERQVADLEQQIYDIESEKAGDRVEETTETADAAKLERAIEKAEYLKLRGKFKSAEQEYYDAIAEDYTTRDHVSKLFGAGRHNLNPSVQEAYDKFMSANKEYYSFAQTSGTYEKIAQRLNRDKAEDEQNDSINSAVAGRHVFRPAEKRLELQTSHLPEGISKLKNNIWSKIRQRPKTAAAVGLVVILGAGAFAGAAATAAYGVRVGTGALVGFGTKIGLAKTYVKGHENKVVEMKSGFIDGVARGEIDFDNVEQAFTAIDSLQQSHTKTKWVAAAAGGAAALAATGAFPTGVGAPDAVSSAGEAPQSNLKGYPADLGIEKNVEQAANSIDTGASVTPESPVNTVGEAAEQVETEPAPEPVAAEREGGSVTESPSSAFEKVEATHTIEKGENISSVLFNHLNELVDQGLVLPEGVEGDEIAHFMYESFPELTNATDTVARLTPEQWVELGVSSGDPNLVYPGETIDINALAEKMLEPAVETTLDPSILNAETPLDRAQEATTSTNNPADNSVSDINQSVEGSYESVDEALSETENASVEAGVSNEPFPTSSEYRRTLRASLGVGVEYIRGGPLQEEWRLPNGEIKMIRFNPTVPNSYEITTPKAGVNGN